MKIEESNIFDTNLRENAEIVMLAIEASKSLDSTAIKNFFFQRALNHIPCTCEEIYKSRDMTAPDCPRCNYL